MPQKRKNQTEKKLKRFENSIRICLVGRGWAMLKLAHLIEYLKYQTPLNSPAISLLSDKATMEMSCQDHDLVGKISSLSKKPRQQTDVTQINKKQNVNIIKTASGAQKGPRGRAAIMNDFLFLSL